MCAPAQICRSGCKGATATLFARRFRPAQSVQTAGCRPQQVAGVWSRSRSHKNHPNTVANAQVSCFLLSSQSVPSPSPPRTTQPPRCIPHGRPVGSRHTHRQVAGNRSHAAGAGSSLVPAHGCLAGSEPLLVPPLHARRNALADPGLALVVLAQSRAASSCTAVAPAGRQGSGPSGAASRRRPLAACPRGPARPRGRRRPRRCPCIRSSSCVGLVAASPASSAGGVPLSGPFGAARSSTRPTLQSRPGP